MGLAPDAVCYAATISALLRAGDCDRSVALLTETREAGLARAPPAQYADAVRVCKAAGRIEQVGRVGGLAEVLRGEGRTDGGIEG